MADRLEVSIDVILHATEDSAKFFDAFEIYDLHKDDFTVSHQTGHFENPITVLSAKIARRQASRFVGRMVRRMKNGQFQEILEDMDLFVSGSGIYLRFDRQEFVQGRLKLLQQSPVRIKIFTPVYRKVDLQSTYRELLESLRRDG